MTKVVATATMYTFLEWRGDIPDDIPEKDWYLWVKENVCGSEFTEIGSGDWDYDDVLEADYE